MFYKTSKNLRSSSLQFGDCYLLLPYNGMLACLVGEFKVTPFGSSSKDDERKKAQIATKPQLGKLAVMASTIKQSLNMLNLYNQHYL